MRPAWRLGISSLSGRRSRTALLVAAVALSAALIAAVSCAMSSMHKGLAQRVQATVGASDVKISRVGKSPLGSELVRQVEAWPEAQAVVPRSQGPILLKHPKTGKEQATVGNGIAPALEQRVREVTMAEGRLPEASGEIAIELAARDELGAVLGDQLDVQRWGDPISLRVVGLIKPAAIGLGVVTRSESIVTIETLAEIAGAQPDAAVQELDVILKDSRQADALAEAKQRDMPQGVVVRPASKVTSGLEQSQRSGQLGMTIASMLATLAGAFIIMTGLMTSVVERLRELAITRCIGATRGQLAESQLVIGAVVGLLGAAVGVPLGVLGAFMLVSMFPEQFPGGFAVEFLGLALGVLASLAAGLLGAIYPAIIAARTPPLEAMASRAKPARPGGLLACVVVGLLFAAAHVTMMSLAPNADTAFWLDMTLGVPSVFIGYFLLSVPTLFVVATVLGPVLARVLGVPSGLLVRTLQKSPYRFGFTSGAMMLGLALLVAIWTNGSMVKDDWLRKFEFPDAFAAGLSISKKTQEKIKALPFVTDTVSITTQNFKSDAFGLRAFDNTSTTFIAFEPKPFFKMATLNWIEGDPATAEAALERGNAVLVAKAFKVTRGLGVGQKIRLIHENTPHEFEIVGVVESPVLDLVTKFYEVGDQYLDMAVNAVFGNRSDLETKFGNSTVRLMQIGLAKDINDADAIKQIRTAGGFEILEAGSGRAIREEIDGYIGASLYVFSMVAIAAMLVACFGVANLIVAGIQARQYEFGVLRAIGAQRGLVARAVLGEAILIALSACVLGTIMGAQAAWAGRRMQSLMIGLDLSPDWRGWISWGPTSMGWVILCVITLGAALPAVLALNRRTPRELLGALRG
jgi:putative ABC transport system permease protein